MNTIDYCQARLMRKIILLSFGGMLAAFMVPGGTFLPWLCGGLCFVAAGLMGAKAFGDRTAILWDQRGVTFIGLISRNSVDWREIEKVTAHRMTQYFLGFIPVNHIDIVSIKTRGGLLASKKYSISASLLELPPGGSAALADLIATAHAAAMAGAAVPGAPRPVVAAVPHVDPGESFDPDAAIARYLARKTSEEAVAAPAPAMPARPVFGRKAV